MFKVSSVDPSSRREAKQLLEEIYQEAPSHWPNGLSLEHFDGGCYLIREKRSSVPVGFCGWQVRNECKALTKSTMKQAGSSEPVWDNLMKSLGVNHIKVGYYSIGIKKAFRRNGFAKEALEKLIAMKSATCDVVRAMISATNLPSQALADVLGVEKLIKHAHTKAAIGEGLLRPLMSGLERLGLKGGAPLMGEDMAKAVRQNGLTMMYPKGWFSGQKVKLPFKGYSAGEKSVPEMISDAIGGTRFFPRVQEVGSKFSGPAISPSGVSMPKGVISAKPPSFEDDKLMEYGVFSKYMPKTVGMDSVASRAPRTAADLATAQKGLHEQLGPNWLLKDRLGSASAPGSMVTEKSPLSAWKGMDPDFTIAQKREALKQNPGWLQRFDNWVNNRTGGAYNNLNRGNHELRVHAMGDRVVPYATVDRGSILRSLTSPFMPFRSPEVRRAEQLVQNALKQNPAAHRGSMYGFDVGIRPDGTPFIIESNPSVGPAMSGFYSNPFVADAVNSGIQGKLPAYVKARRLIYGTGLVGGGAAMMPQQHREPTAMDRWNMVRARLGM